MKTILVPTDFSETAMNAAIYASELAASLGAKVLLFHAYHPPLPTASPDFGILPDYDMDKENNALLDKFKTNLLAQISTSVELSGEVRIGFALEEIEIYANEKKPDLIVMGISGGGRINEFILGSNTTGLIRKISIPSIIVPPKAKFKKPSGIVFACDYKTEIASNVISTLKQFLHLFQSNLLVLNMEKPEDGVTFEKAVNGINLENALGNVMHTLHFLPQVGDIANEINDFIEVHDAQLLVVVPHRQSLLGSLFHKSTTKHLAFHTQVPILALHE